MSILRNPKPTPINEPLSDEEYEAQQDWLLRIGTNNTGVDIDVAEAGEWALRTGGVMAANAVAAHGLTTLIGKVSAEGKAGIEKR